MPALERWIRRYVRLLLRAYPPGFRQRFGKELEDSHVDCFLMSGQGQGPGRALRACGRAFFHAVRDGTMERICERRASRDSRSGSIPPGEPIPRNARGRALGTLGQDVRFGVRSLRRRPLFAAIAVGILGLGIGTSTAMFSVVHGVLVEAPPFRDPGQLVSVFRVADRWRELEGFADFWDRGPLSETQYAAWRDGTTMFREVGAHMVAEMTLTGHGTPRREMVGLATSSLFPLLGVRPILGRWFLPEEEGGAPGEGARVAMISRQMWLDELGSDPGVLGSVLTLDDQDFTVVGVLPDGFKLRWLCWSITDEPDDGEKDIWIPMGAQAQTGMGGFEGLGRLAPGATMEQARLETERLVAAVTERADESTRIQPRQDADNRGLTSPLALLLAASGILLLIACGNVAMLVMGEMPRRDREITTRSALGAGAGRIARQLLTESLLLSSLGAMAGAGVAWAAIRVLVAMAPPLPRVDQIGVDLPVLLFAVGLGALAGFLFGTAPAVISARGSLRPAGNTFALRTGGVHRATLVGEITLTVVLLVTAGLLSRSYLRILSVDPGFDAENLAALQITLLHDRFGIAASPDSPPNAEFHTFAQRVLEEVEAVPGVRSAGLTSSLPFPARRLWGFSMLWDETREPDPATGRVPRVWATAYWVTPGYLETLDIPLLAGRTLTGHDDADAPAVLVVSEAFAQLYWPNASPIGAPVRGPDTHYTVVGVVGDAQRETLTAEVEPTFYASLSQMWGWSRRPTVVARTEGDPSAVVPLLREAIWRVDPTVSIGIAGSMEALVTESASDVRYRTFLIGAFAILAAILAAAGVFGVTARAVAFRRKEMGIRLALGATTDHLTGSTVWATLRTTAVGIVVGLAVSLWAGALLSDFLFGVTPSDPTTFGGVLLLVVSVCLVSSYLPARRVAKLNPLDVLQAE